MYTIPLNKPPTGQSPEGRQAITQAFDAYVQALEPLYEEFGAFPHWAKVGESGIDRFALAVSTLISHQQIEVPQDPARLQRMKERLWARYPIDAFNLVRCVRACGSCTLIVHPYVYTHVDVHAHNHATLARALTPRAC